MKINKAKNLIISVFKKGIVKKEILSKKNWSRLWLDNQKKIKRNQLNNMESTGFISRSCFN